MRRTKGLALEKLHAIEYKWRWEGEELKKRNTETSRMPKVDEKEGEDVAYPTKFTH